MTKDGGWKMPFILRGPVLYGSARSKKKRQESSSQRQALHRPGAVNHRTCLLSHIRVSGLGWP
jgi:hypothetical protein